MPDILNLTSDMLKSFLLVLIRVSIVLFMFPIFSGEKVSRNIKAALAFSISLGIVPVVHPDPALFPNDVANTVFLVVKEFIVGFILGLSVNVFFEAVQMGGQLVGSQMGLAIATIMDPNSGIQTSLVSQFGYWVMLVVFLLLNGHYYFIAGIIESFEILKPGALVFQEGLYKTVVMITASMFVMSIKISAPAIAALIFTDVAFALTARVSPQMNVLVVALPLKIAIGLFFWGISMQMVLFFTKDYVKNLLPMLKNLLKLMSG